MTDDPRSDRELLAAFRRGDGAAFEALYRRHRAFVLRVALRFVGRDEDAALDVLQEAFAYLIRQAPGLQLRHRLTTFLYPVTRHLAADRRRRQERQPGPLGPEDEPAIEPEFAGDVREWFAGLGPLQREVLGLRFADGLSLEEIAAALDVPLGTAKSRLHNAIAQLREKLGNE